MMFFKTPKGFVVVSEGHSRYFERNFNWTAKFRIISPQLIYPKHPKKPYGVVSKEKIEECVTQNLKQYIAQIENIENLIVKFKLFSKKSQLDLN